MKSQIIAVLCLVGIVASQTVPATKVVSSSTQVNAGVPSMQQQLMKAQTVQVKTQQTTKKGCYPLCKTPLETCVRLARCQGDNCFQCAMTVSIVLPGTAKTTTVETKVARPMILPANYAAIQSLLAQGAMTQQPTQTTGFNGLFGSRDPFQNMMMGSMLFDGGLGMF